MARLVVARYASIEMGIFEKADRVLISRVGFDDRRNFSRYDFVKCIKYRKNE